MTSLTQHQRILEDLRAGHVTFDRVAVTVRDALHSRADRFLKAWGWSGQRSVDAEDLVQEMLVALWRAVDSWDSTRSTLVRYVDAQVGRAAQRRLRQTAGYPDPRRKPPARQSNGRLGFDPDSLECESTTSPEADVIAARRAKSLINWLGGIERHVVELVIDGNTLDEATEVIYADPDARIDYQMDSVIHARQLVGLAMRRATNEL